MTKWAHSVMPSIFRFRRPPFFCPRLPFILNKSLMESSPLPIDRSEQIVRWVFLLSLERLIWMKWPWIRRCQRTECWKKKNRLFVLQFSLMISNGFFCEKLESINGLNGIRVRWFTRRISFVPRLVVKRKTWCFLSSADRHFFVLRASDFATSKLFVHRKRLFLLSVGSIKGGKPTTMMIKQRWGHIFAMAETRASDAKLPSMEMWQKLFPLFNYHPPGVTDGSKGS